jgi:signal peptidase I
VPTETVTNELSTDGRANAGHGTAGDDYLDQQWLHDTFAKGLIWCEDYRPDGSCTGTTEVERLGQADVVLSHLALIATDEGSIKVGATRTARITPDGLCSTLTATDIHTVLFYRAGDKVARIGSQDSLVTEHRSEVLALLKDAMTQLLDKTTCVRFRPAAPAGDDKGAPEIIGDQFVDGVKQAWKSGRRYTLFDPTKTPVLLLRASDGRSTAGPGYHPEPRREAVATPIIQMTIPSGSMLPTIAPGAEVTIDTKAYEDLLPKRGDLLAFRFPDNPSVNSIKRVVGLPGDLIGYFDKTVYVNGKAQPQQLIGSDGGEEAKLVPNAVLEKEDLSGVSHGILIQPWKPSIEGTFRVPEGHYFVMGDNRDNSNDSRYWGAVPRKDVIGKVIAVNGSPVS